MNLNIPEMERARLNYNLNEDSVVFDVGGYNGKWAEKVHNKFNCYVYIFEPIVEYYNQCVNRFKMNNKIKVYNFGLYSENTKVDICVDNDASSIFNEGSNTEEIELVDIYHFFNENHQTPVDLLKINIEGAEYDLLDRMIETEMFSQFKNIQIQFHNPLVENGEERREKIIEQLKGTHNQTFYYPVWESWGINDVS